MNQDREDHAYDGSVWFSATLAITMEPDGFPPADFDVGVQAPGTRR